MRLCMFSPADRHLERGWVGRLDGEHVTHLAAQTLQSFFTGGGAAREHAMYPLAGLHLLAPVLHPPSVRVFDDQDTFWFANPAAICGPDSIVPTAPCDDQAGGRLALHSRVAAIVGTDGEIAGFTLLAEWRRTDLEPPKDRDFALGLGPLVVTRDEVDLEGLEAFVRVDGEERLHDRFEVFDWAAARDLAAEGTRLYPGDLLAGPALNPVNVDGSAVELDVPSIGALAQKVSRD